MSKICEVIQHSLKMGYLTQEAKEELRQLLQNTKYGVVRPKLPRPSAC
ncbi:hypothetical protein PL8927_600012 [Planktothrix serta PCC 8927]|uniref:Uncharacterized protein n=1 Tax=Planktothrix serta PCC 8927 TaxID=671068 RepID=A0A7Z9BRW2_9CYAN|nr:hypothetical protein [Planktothrix serta]VXD17558.1 hypothetical protein PL8927_600012 [Planktothrix serta PCC 8927]